MRLDPVRIGVVCTCLTLPAACEAAPEASTFEEADSAGVTLALNSGDAPTPNEGVVVGGDPLLELGTLSGDSLYQFSRIQGGARLSDGRLAILDGGSTQLRIYGADGVFERAWGSEGAGPGEFRRPQLAGRSGDTLVVLDSNNRRVSRWLPDEGLVDEVSLAEDAGGFFQVQGLFGDGTVVSGGGFFFSSASGQSLESGYRRSPTGFVRLGHDGTIATDFGEFPGLEMYFEVGESNISARLVPFGKITDGAVTEDHVYVGTSDRPEVMMFGRDGTHVRTIRWAQAPVQVSATDLADYREESLAEADDEDERRRIRSLVESHAAETFPAYQNLEADRLGYLWVNEYRAPSDDIPRYRIFDPQGRQVARVTLPPRVGVLEIGGDYLLARYFDEFDVEYVVLYPLERGDG